MELNEKEDTECGKPLINKRIVFSISNPAAKMLTKQKKRLS